MQFTIPLTETKNAERWLCEQARLGPGIVRDLVSTARLPDLRAAVENSISAPQTVTRRNPRFAAKQWFTLQAVVKRPVIPFRGGRAWLMQKTAYKKERRTRK